MDWIYLVILIFIIFIVIMAMLASCAVREIRVDELEKLRLGGGKLRVKNLLKHPRSKSEAEAIRYLEDITGKKFPTAYPKWLIWKGKHLELDGYNGSIALEFSGPLHTKWSPDFEPYIDYFERIVRDVVKRRLCKKYKVNLIVVDVSIPSKHWRNYILSRLFDIGAIGDRPTTYIDEQVAEPYRNEQLENELGIANEYEIASRL